ncbi:NMUR2 [Cervus elaphus hippelaphus]|uniref:NMUR2 n=1 Tax=Cervus elaphus hippelaphus TaxID=46360 RepID=A0A212D167_CEREH|nr:NMUR2 [Cervus elaphus hippelaphus]
MEKHENVSWIYQQELEDPFKKYLNNTDDYLALLCGPRRSHLFLPVTVVYALIFVVGVVGNLLVCLVILRHQTMKTPTNYYLFSLAVSDLLVLLLGMPLEVYEMWRNYPFLFGPVGCYFKTALFETELVVLVLVFAICWAPFHIDRLFFSFVEEWTEPLAAVFNLIHVVSGVFFYLSSAVNPIIYNLLSLRFQAAFRTVIPPSCQQQHSHNHSPGPSVQRNIFLTECHLVELTEDAEIVMSTDQARERREIFQRRLRATRVNFRPAGLHSPPVSAGVSFLRKATCHRLPSAPLDFGWRGQAEPPRCISALQCCTAAAATLPPASSKQEIWTLWMEPGQGVDTSLPPSPPPTPAATTNPPRRQFVKLMQ